MSLEQTRRRHQAVGTIHDVVSAMRAIAAGRIQGAQHALAIARRYQDVVLRALGALGVAAPPGPTGGPPLVLVLSAEQPFCGAFNQNVLALAEKRWAELRQAGPAFLAVVGLRGVRQLQARGVSPDVAEPAATTLPGLRDLVKRLTAVVDRRYAVGQAGALHVIYNRYQSVSEQVPTEERILPVDWARLPRPASPAERYHRYLPDSALLTGLVSEYAFISLYRAAADSFAGEQAARLVAMDAATRNTERVLRELLDQERRERQGQITRQVLELIGARFAAG